VRNDVLQRFKKEMNILQTIRRRNANWIVHTFGTNCILKQVIEGKIERRIEVMGRQGRRRKQPLGDIREISGY